MRGEPFHGVPAVVALAMVLLMSGCTGIRMDVMPNPDSLKLTVTNKCGSVGVREVAAEHVYPPAGNLVPGFAQALERSGLFDKVYYPLKPDDRPDMTLDARFEVLFDPHKGANMTRSCVIAFTLFLLEPFILYHLDYNLNGQVAVRKGNARAETLSATTETDVSIRFFSLEDAATFEGETIARSKDSLYRQLILEMNEYCRGH